VVSANLNSEAVEQLELQVVVEDLPAVGERLRSHSDLNIRVEDVSDNSLVFMSTEYSGLVTENSPVGINILSVLATDADVNKTIKYNITLLIT
jgi:cadherin 23